MQEKPDILFRQLLDAASSSYTYLLADAGSAVLIDPVLTRIDRDLKLLDEMGLTLRYAVDTHLHADHVTAAGALRHRTGCRTVVSRRGPESADIQLRDGESLRIGDVILTGLWTPGHTADSMSYQMGNNVFTGDTLLVRGCGRTDFQNGDAGTLYDSIHRQLFSLPDRTRIWPGHDYGGHAMTTVGEEKLHNPRLAGTTREEFVTLMGRLNLPDPELLDEIVPANYDLGMGLDPSSQIHAFRECTTAALSCGGSWDHIIDVRQPQEFSGELGHIAGAVNVPMAEVPEFAARLPRHASLLVVCRSGRRSREVCRRLAELGMSDLTNLEEGMLGYQERILKIA